MAKKLTESNNEQRVEALCELTSDHQNNLIAELCSITGADESVAGAFLSALSWNVDVAMNRFFELNGDASKVMPQFIEQADIHAMAPSKKSVCFCRSTLQRVDGILESRGIICNSCFRTIKNTLYVCNDRHYCWYQQLVGSGAYSICSECYNLSIGDSPENETETNSNEFVCKKVDISLTKIS